MPPLGSRLLNTIHIVALGIWTGGLLMTGIAAAILFPTIRALNPALPSYERFTEPHWAIAAGHVGRRIFLAADVVQMTAAGLTLLGVGGLIIAGRWPRHTIIGATRLALIGAALTLVCYQLIVLGGRMDTNLTGYWTAAREGHMDEALRLRAAFEADHPVASRVAAATALATLTALCLGAWQSTLVLGDRHRGERT